MTTTELIQELKKITETNIEVINQKLSRLSESQRNWRKDLDSWNINEIFAHLNEFTAYYHPVFISKIEKTRFNEPKEIFISSPLGRSAWKSMKLGNAKNVKRKFKSTRNNNPLFNKELVKGNDLSSFEENQHAFLSIIDLASTVNMRKVKIPISISKIVRLKLGDALLYVAYHNERHVQQALNLISNKKFPAT